MIFGSTKHLPKSEQFVMEHSIRNLAVNSYTMFTVVTCVSNIKGVCVFSIFTVNNSY
jgi:hypothetical protein